MATAIMPDKRHTIKPLTGKANPVFLLTPAIISPATASNEPIKASGRTRSPTSGIQQNMHAIMPKTNEAMPSGLTPRLASTLVLLGGMLSWVFLTLGINSVVSNPQCGQADICPAISTGNAICPLQN